MNDACIARMTADRQWLLDHKPDGLLHRTKLRTIGVTAEAIACDCGETHHVLFYDPFRDGGLSRAAQMETRP